MADNKISYDFVFNATEAIKSADALTNSLSNTQTVLKSIGEGRIKSDSLNANISVLKDTSNKLKDVNKDIKETMSLLQKEISSLQKQKKPVPDEAFMQLSSLSAKYTEYKNAIAETTSFSRVHIQQVKEQVKERETEAKALLKAAEAQTKYNKAIQDSITSAYKGQLAANLAAQQESQRKSINLYENYIKEFTAKQPKQVYALPTLIEKTTGVTSSKQNSEDFTYNYAERLYALEQNLKARDALIKQTAIKEENDRQKAARDTLIREQQTLKESLDLYTKYEQEKAQQRKTPTLDRINKQLILPDDYLQQLQDSRPTYKNAYAQLLQDKEDAAKEEVKRLKALKEEEDARLKELLKNRMLFEKQEYENAKKRNKDLVTAELEATKETFDKLKNYIIQKYKEIDEKQAAANLHRNNFIPNINYAQRFTEFANNLDKQIEYERIVATKGVRSREAIELRHQETLKALREEYKTKFVNAGSPLSTYGGGGKTVSMVQIDYEKALRNAMDETTKALRENESALVSNQRTQDHFFTRIFDYVIGYRIVNSVINTLSNALSNIPKQGIAFEASLATFKAVFVTTEAVNQQFAYLDALALKTGARISTLREQFGAFAANAKFSNETLENTKTIFSNLVESATVLHLSEDRLKSALVAINQMYAKGTIMSEELKKQLGNQLPAVVPVMALSRGVSTAKLMKEMQAGEVKPLDTMVKFSQMYKDLLAPVNAFESASSGLMAQLGRLSNAWTNLSQSIYDATKGQMSAAVTFLANTMTTFANKGKEIATTLGVAVVYALASYAKAVSSATIANERLAASQALVSATARSASASELASLTARANRSDTRIILEQLSAFATFATKRFVVVASIVAIGTALSSLWSGVYKVGETTVTTGDILSTYFGKVIPSKIEASINSIKVLKSAIQDFKDFFSNSGDLLVAFDKGFAEHLSKSQNPLFRLLSNFSGSPENGFFGLGSAASDAAAQKQKENQKNLAAKEFERRLEENQKLLLASVGGDTELLTTQQAKSLSKATDIIEKASHLVISAIDKDTQRAIRNIQAEENLLNKELQKNQLSINDWYRKRVDLVQKEYDLTMNRLSKEESIIQAKQTIEENTNEERFRLSETDEVKRQTVVQEMIQMKALLSELKRTNVDSAKAYKELSPEQRGSEGTNTQLALDYIAKQNLETFNVTNRADELAKLAKTYEDKQQAIVKLQLEKSSAKETFETLFNAIKQVESSNRQFDKKGNVVTSDEGAIGISQVLPSTAAQFGYTKEQITSSQAANEAAGKSYLASLLKHYENDIPKAIAAYNVGQDGLDTRLANNRNLPSETTNFTKNVLSLFTKGKTGSLSSSDAVMTSPQMTLNQLSAEQQKQDIMSKREDAQLDKERKLKEIDDQRLDAIKQYEQRAKEIQLAAEETTSTNVIDLATRKAQLHYANDLLIADINKNQQMKDNINLLVKQERILAEIRQFETKQQIQNLAFDAQSDAIKSRRNESLITDFEAIQQESDLAAQKFDYLSKQTGTILSNIHEQYKNDTNMEQQKILEFSKQLADVNAQTKGTINFFKGVGVNAFSNFFSVLSKGSLSLKTLGNAFKSFAMTFVEAMQKIIMDKIATKATNILFDFVGKVVGGGLGGSGSAGSAGGLSSGGYGSIDMSSSSLNSMSMGVKSKHSIPKEDSLGYSTNKMKNTHSNTNIIHINVQQGKGESSEKMAENISLEVVKAIAKHEAKKAVDTKEKQNNITQKRRA